MFSIKFSSSFLLVKSHFIPLVFLFSSHIFLAFCPEILKVKNTKFSLFWDSFSTKDLPKPEEPPVINILLSIILYLFYH